MTRPLDIPKRANGTGTVSPGPRPGTWTIFLPRPKGAPKRSKTFTGTERNAHRELDRWIDDLAAGRAESSKAPTIATVAENFKQWSRENHSASNQALTEWIIDTLIIGKKLDGARKQTVRDDSLANIRVNELTREHVEQWMSRMFDRGLSRSTIKHYRQPLHHMIERLVEDRRYGLVVNVVSRASVPKNAPAKGREVQWLEVEQARAFIDQCSMPGETWGPYFLICGTLGLRPGEGLALTRDHFDLDAGTVAIVQSLKRRNDKPIGVGDLKNEKQGRRIVELPDIALDAYKRQLDLIVEYSVTASDPRWQGLLFLRDGGEPPYQSSMRKALDALIERANLRLIDEGSKIEIPRITPYSLRHTCASIMLDVDNPDVEEVARLLGTSVDMLREHYWHILEKRKVGRGLASRWNDLT